MNVCSVLARDHLRHLLDQRKDRVSHNICVEGELLEADDVLSANDLLFDNLHSYVLDLVDIATFCNDVRSFCWNDPGLRLCSCQSSLDIDHA